MKINIFFHQKNLELWAKAATIAGSILSVAGAVFGYSSGAYVVVTAVSATAWARLRNTPKPDGLPLTERLKLQEPLEAHQHWQQSATP